MSSTDVLRAIRDVHMDHAGLLAAELADHLEATRVVLTDSGTTALQLALRVALRAADGGPVAAPAFSCFDVATALVGVSAESMLYDVNPVTLTPDGDSVRRALHAGARVVLVAPLYGYPPPWDALAALVAEHGAVLVEDAAQMHGSSWHGRAPGSMARISVLSFGRGKGWTGAGGGALVLHGDDIPALPPLSRATSRDAARVLVRALALATLARPSRYALAARLPGLRLGVTQYHAPGEPVAMTRLSAALLRATRVGAEREAAVRLQHGEWLAAELETSHAACIVRGDGARPGYLRLPVRLEGGWSALNDEVRLRRLGLAPSYPSALGAVLPLRPLLRGRLTWPGAEELVRTLVTLPTHGALTAGELHGAVAAVRRATRQSA